MFSFNPANETLVFLGTLAIGLALFAFITAAFLGALGILGIVRLVVFGAASLLSSAPSAARRVPEVLHLRRTGALSGTAPELEGLPDAAPAVRKTA